MYNEIADGERLDDARQTAVVAHIQQYRGTKYDAPRYWASSVILGFAGELDFFQQESIVAPWFLFGIGAFALLMAVAVIRKYFIGDKSFQPL